MFSSRLQIVEPAELSSEDYFASAPSFIFPNDTCDFHGKIGLHVIYRSESFGDIELELADPEGEDTWKLFAHYAKPQVVDKFSPKWQGERVLELGAGTGLVSLLAAKAGVEEVVVSDYPKDEVIDKLQANVKYNVPLEIQPNIRVQAHQWGSLEDAFAAEHAKCFTRITCADCLWVADEHLRLVESMQHFLAEGTQARIWVSAGFHTGRRTVAQFFHVAADAGLEPLTIWERNANTAKERPWVEGRDESTADSKQWLVAAILRRNS